jgi:hypothetical protein
MNNQDFICPECGSNEAGVTTNVSAIPEERYAWTSVLKRIRCAKCRRDIPAHMAERWDGLSFEEAQKE